MNKKTIFNKHLYKEGMRTLTPIASILLALLSVFSILYSVNIRMNQSDYSYSFISTVGDLNTQYGILYFIIIVLVVPILTLRIFSFLTTRNGSDFYHAIPHKRQCVYLSFAAAVFSWVVLCILCPVLLSYAIYRFGGLTMMSVGMLSMVILHMMVAALLVLSTICVACAITGTILTNIITTGLLLFFPRLFIYACRLCLSLITGRYVLTNGFFFGTKCNLVVHSVLGPRNSTYYLYRIAPLVYTLVLSILYLIVAVFLFERRHSELAMKATLSKRLQDIFCLMLGTAASMVPIAVILQINRYSEDASPSTIFGLFTVYLLIVIGMGVYELLTTKRIRNLVRLIPRTGLLAVINVLLIFGLYGGKHLTFSSTPNASKIQSVSFEFAGEDSPIIFSDNYAYNTLLSEINDDSYYNMGTSADYFRSKANSYQTSDETVKKIIANCLADRSDQEDSSQKQLLVTVNTGVRKITRLVNISRNDFKTIKDIVYKDSSFASIYKELPKVSSDTLSLSSDKNASLSNDALYELYETACNDMTSLTDEEAIDLRSSGNFVDYLYFAKIVNGIYTDGTIPITPKLMTTYQKYITLVNDANKNAVKAFADIFDKKHEYFSCSYDFSLIDPSTSFSISDGGNVWYDIMSSSKSKELLTAMIAAEETPVDFTNMDSYIIKISMSWYTDSERQTSCKYIQLDKKTINPIIKDLNKLSDGVRYEEDYQD